MKKLSIKYKYLIIIFFVFIIILFFFFLPQKKIKSVSSSYYNSCYTTDDGKLFVYGMNSDGQLGDFDGKYSYRPQKIETPSKVKIAVASLNSIVYIDQNNEVYMIGIYGKNGDEYQRTNTPQKISGLVNIKDIKAGEMHFLALDYNGDVWAWGENECKQVSYEKNVDTWIPQKVNDLNNIVNIECGFYTSCAFSKDSVFIWGEDSIGLSENDFFENKYILNIENIEKVSLGRNHMVVKTKDDILGYGSNAFGQMGQLGDFLYGDSLDIENVDNISCAITSTVFTISGKVYYLGDIDPFDDVQEKDELSLCDINIGDISQVDCNGFHLIAANKSNVQLYGNNSIVQAKSNSASQESEATDLTIAILDTGVDTNNEIIENILSKSENVESEQGIFHKISKWNLCAGNEQIVDDVLTDSHGTGMFGLVIDIKWSQKSDQIESYQNDFNLIQLKVLNKSGGRFIDVLTAIRIADLRGAEIINCSFSIKNQCYENILENVIEDSKSFFVFSLDNDMSEELFTIKLPNIIYAADNDINKSKSINLMNVNIGEVKILGFNNYNMFVQGNSCATAYLTNKIANMYLNEQTDLSYSDIIKNYNKIFGVP